MSHASYSEVLMMFRFNESKEKELIKVNIQESFGKVFSTKECETDEHLNGRRSLQTSLSVSSDESYYIINLHGRLSNHPFPEAYQLMGWFEEKCQELDPYQAMITLHHSVAGVMMDAYLSEAHLSKKEESITDCSTCRFWNKDEDSNDFMWCYRKNHPTYGLVDCRCYQPNEPTSESGER